MSAVGLRRYRYNRPSRFVENEPTFVTELSSPVGVAETLPGFLTGAMNTAGVWDTLIAVLPLPPIQTPAQDRDTGYRNPEPVPLDKTIKYVRNISTSNNAADFVRHHVCRNVRSVNISLRQEAMKTLNITGIALASIATFFPG